MTDRKPTPKQARFAELVVSGASLVDAYRVAYDAEGMSAASASHEAGELARHPLIAPLIEAGRKEAMKEATWNRARAIQLLELVNAKCFSVIDKAEGVPPREAISGFFDSLDRLNNLCCCDLETQEAQWEFEHDPERVRQRERKRREAFNAEMEL